MNKAMTASAVGGIVAVLAAGWCVLHAANPDLKEVVVESRPLRSWLEEMFSAPPEGHDPFFDTRDNKAQAVLRRFCTDPKKAIPALAAALGDKKEIVRRAAATCLGDYCKTDVKSVLPPLLKTLREDESSSVREAAVEALSTAGPEVEVVRAALLKALKEDKAADVRAIVIRQFRHIKPTTELPALTDAMKDDAWEVRLQAVLAVAEFGKPEATIPLLIHALEDKDERVSWWAAAIALGDLCPKAIPALRQALQDKNPCVRAAAVLALGKAPEAVKPLVCKELPAILPLLDDKEGVVRANAARTLGILQDPVAVPALVAKLDDADIGVRSACVGALGWIGSDAAVAVDKLLKLLRDRDPILRHQTAHAFGRIGPKAKAAALALGEALTDEDQAVRWMVADALGDIGPEAKAAVPKLKEALKTDDKELKRKVERALKKIGAE